MRIWFDLRLLEDKSPYAHFAKTLTKYFIQKNNSYTYNIYVQKENIASLGLSEDKAKVWELSITHGTLNEQLQFWNILKKNKNDIMIFFHYSKPLLYKKEYYLFIPSLKEIHYSNWNSVIDKYKNLYLLEKNLKNARKIICFEKNTKNELIERFNIRENKIEVLPAFFYDDKEETKILSLDTNPLTKYTIEKKYFLYEWGTGIEKNIEKLLEVLKKFKKDFELIILWERIAQDVELRNRIITYELQTNIKFLGNISTEEKKVLYEKATALILPSLYETFPFHMGNALQFDTPILCSNIPNIRNIFLESVYYFSPISKNNMLSNIKKFLSLKRRKTDYNFIRKKYSVANTLKYFTKIIS